MKSVVKRNSDGIPASRRLDGNRHDDVIMAILAVLLAMVGEVMMAM